MQLEVRIRGFFVTEDGNIDMAPAVSFVDAPEKFNSTKGNIDFEKIGASLADMLKDFPGGPVRAMTKEEADAYRKAEDEDGE